MEKRVLESERDVKTLKARVKATRKNGLANVVVICGGKSFEHDISILTAQTIVQAVPSEFNAFLLYQSLWGDLF